MKKVLSVEQIREADAYTIKNEPVASVDLMERASMKCVKWLEAYQDRIYSFYIFCGPGNNGGDGLAIARLLSEKGFEVKVVIPQISKKYSADFKINHDRLIQQKKCEIVNLKSLADFPEISENHIIIDAIFGSGLSKPVSGLAAELIDKINKLDGITIAIDIPSGMFADQSSVIEKAPIIQADYTLSFQFPKLAFFMSENDIYVGKWEILSIGLSEKFMDEVQVKDYLIKKSDCIKVYRKRAKFSHKGNYGHALLVAGSLGKMGAAVLASKACLRSGVGLLTSHIPQVGNDILQTAVPESMLSLGRFENYFSDVPDLRFYSAIGVGPGIGMEEQTRNALKVLIQNAHVPMVFDADALNILAENKTWLAFLPKGCVITPHPKEFERLAGKSTNDFERVALAKVFAVKHNLVVVLKGAYTQIVTPSGECFFNSTGNPGMATAGSGDVLTGIILSLMAQGYSSVHAALIGVYVHGLAGDQAAKKMSEASIIASDIIENLGKAFKKIEIKKVK
ncbi:MAG: bifunctional ADP-dependent NAD(P)H-hydrate dehydratase/NAD(P)H-hydrate epimerase [Bacteroidetes bacterium HGW-Bacteroidetes-17]|jgi:NAD(P)H-hydrate epimerase|nr:MAG: bifunctional ADP-dependent NAD(P)H-hydrate dehydratase/NAD(P)H-hydrate epimerase [Bacteroidetes bacterium HGW-Bacteroidetes-17]